MAQTDPVPRLNRAREEAAHRELGETRVGRGVAWGIAVAFGLTLFAPAALEALWHGPDADGVGPAFARLADAPLDACTIEAVESDVEEQSAFANRLRPHVQRLLTAAFGIGNEQALVAGPGWLLQQQGFAHVSGAPFLDEAVQARRVRNAGACATRPAPDPVAAITRFHRDLEARGIGLVVMPTPVKATLRTDRVVAAELPQNRSFLRFVDALEAEGVVVFDPAPLLAQWQARPDTPSAYLPTDTHWRPEAMEIVAASLAAFLQRVFPLGSRTPGRAQGEERVANRGDLAALLDLPAGANPYPLEEVTIHPVLGPDGRPWRPTRNAPVLLLGDSFSNIYSVRDAFAQVEGGRALDWGAEAGLAEQLSLRLARPVDRIARNAGGADATRRSLLRELGGPNDRLRGVRVVVWQFATRELSFGDWPVLPLPPQDD